LFLGTVKVNFPKELQIKEYLYHVKAINNIDNSLYTSEILLLGNNIEEYDIIALREELDMNKNKRKNFMVGSIIFTLLLLILIFYFYKQKIS